MFVNVVIVVACACACVCVWQRGANAQPPVVDTEHGKVIGVQEDEQISFYDIPYGAPTSGERRFEAPTPAPYKEEFYATNKNVTCAQLTVNGIRGTEDCLVLSIHTNSLLTRKPVLVWLESENYETTPAIRHSFRNLVSEGLVIVSLSHRLSIFGFLCLRIPEAPGNAGLLDIVLGLKWIRRNINNFGGDPSNVVLLGHGSGAALADILTLSPITDGLIHKAIILSGSALASWAVSYKNIDNAKAVGKKLGLPNASKQLLAKSLKTVPVNNLLKSLNDLSKDNLTPLFAPCIDTNDIILANDPINLLKSGNFNKIPYLTGYTDKEGTIKAEGIINGTWTEEIRRNLTEFLPPDITFESKSNKTNVMNEISNLYFTNSPTKEKEIDEVLIYVGDVLQIIPIIRSVKERTKRISSFSQSKPNVFLFEFQYQGTNNSNWAYPQSFLNGAKHGDILNYILDFDLPHSYSNKTKLNYAAMSLKKRFVKFAYTGLPEPDIEKYTSWLPITDSFFNYFHIAGSVNTFHSQSQEMYPSEKITFWDDIYSKYYRPLSSSACGLSYGILILVCYVTCVFVNLQ